MFSSRIFLEKVAKNDVSSGTGANYGGDNVSSKSELSFQQMLEFHADGEAGVDEPWTMFFSGPGAEGAADFSERFDAFGVAGQEFRYGNFRGIEHVPEGE